MGPGGGHAIVARRCGGVSRSGHRAGRMRRGTGRASARDRDRDVIPGEWHAGALAETGVLAEDEVDWPIVLSA